MTGEFVGAPTVPLILGLGRTTVQVRGNRFVIPHRFANRKPLFLLDDLGAWMPGEAVALKAGASQETPKEPPS